MNQAAVKILNNMSWNITTPISKAYTYEDDVKVKLPSSFLNTPVKIGKNDSVAILWYDNEPILTEPVKGSTLKHIFASIEKGMNRILENNSENRKIVYLIISNFLKSDMRISLIKKFESNKLKALDIAGDHVFFDGNLSKINKIWGFALGS